MVVFTERRSFETSDERAMEIAQAGWKRNGETFMNKNGALWISEKSLVGQNLSDVSFDSLTYQEIEMLRAAGFTPIEREQVEIDGKIQPSNMVLCEKNGKRVRVRLEPGSDHLTGAVYDDAGEQV